eukprot:6153955-Amphidinium_carterae.1
MKQVKLQTDMEMWFRLADNVQATSDIARRLFSVGTYVHNKFLPDKLQNQLTKDSVGRCKDWRRWRGRAILNAEVEFYTVQ